MRSLVGVMRLNVVIPSGGIAGRNSTEEDMVSDTTERGGSHKTLAIRLDEAVHAQLSVIAGLRKSTITEEIRQAIDEHINMVRSNPELVNSAESAIDDIEREIAARKAAITALFGEPAPAPTSGRKTSRGGAKEDRPEA